MRIKKLDIKGFGKLNNIVLDFDDSFNIVYGRNESGKTSIQWFIKGMLYGLKGGRAGKDGTLPPLKRFKPWNSPEYGGIMEYRLENGEIYRIARNFSKNTVNIYDSLFNDLTGNFEISKEKGSLFAEKHLGITENCFEKTVLIKQMDTRIDAEGSKELLNRLTNVIQTGYEDVSYKKAHEVLKEAFKTYIGTDKTSTRPMDKVLTRLQELKSLKDEIMQKRLKLFDVEKELIEAYSYKAILEQRKSAFEKVREFIAIRKKMADATKARDEIIEILEEIRAINTEICLLDSRIDEFNRDKAELSRFSGFDSEDIDKISYDFNTYLHLIEENNRIKADTLKKEEDLRNLGSSIEHLKAFEGSDPGLDSEVLQMGKELERLTAEWEKSSLDSMNEEINSSFKIESRLRLGILLSSIFSVLFFFYGLLNRQSRYTGIAVSLVLFFVTVCFIYSFVKCIKHTKELINKKNMSFVYANSIIEQIEGIRERMANKFSTVGANSMEEYLALKAEYDREYILVKNLQGEIAYAQSRIESNHKRISSLKEGIQSRLVLSGVDLSSTAEITEESINEFKNGIRKFKGLEPAISYTVKRKEDILDDLSSLQKKLQLSYGIDSRDEAIISKVIDDYSRNIDNLKAISESHLNELLNTCSCEEIKLLNLENINLQISGEDLAQVELVAGTGYDKTLGELKELDLKIRELETFIKSQEVDNDKIQQIEEEIYELELKKSQLEDTGISLRIALETLDEASSEIQRDFVPVLNRKMSEIIDKISSGRYKDLRANDQLSLNVIAPETGSIVPALLLSSGTIDQVYLALRLAMADFMTTQGEKLPLLLDEIFAQFDDSRTSRTFDLLKELSADTQIIFFTCKERELEIARQRIGDNLNIIEI